MADYAKRFKENPLLTPAVIKPSRPDLYVPCILNPGVFTFDGRVGLLLRVAEWPHQEEKVFLAPVHDPLTPQEIKILRFDGNDSRLETIDRRLFKYNDQIYLTTLSHLRLAWSDDGVHFTVENEPILCGKGKLEEYGIEDCRVTCIDNRYYCVYTAVSSCGVGVSMVSTSDWKTVDYHGMILPPHNKDCALFTHRIHDRYYCFHRPSSIGIGGNYIWLSSSPDLLHWGDHHCIVKTRPGMWDSQKVGAGAAPIATEKGWLCIYHGADETDRYCLGAFLLDTENPAIVKARTREPIMEPCMKYEKYGFYGNVIFTNGHIVNGDEITIYYGAADEVICGARFSIEEILGVLAM